MSVLRAAARVTSPDGREWEVYAYKITWQKPARRRDIWRSLVAAFRALRAPDWTIDAITEYPLPLVLTWTTTTEHKGQVLAQVEGHLARGDVPLHLTHAIYRGERRSAR